MNFKRGGWNCSELLLFIPTQSPAGAGFHPAQGCQPRQGLEPKQTWQVRLTTIPLMALLAQGELLFSYLFLHPLLPMHSSRVLESTPDSPVQMTWFSLQLEDADLLNALGEHTVLSKHTHWVFTGLQYTSLEKLWLPSLAENWGNEEEHLPVWRFSSPGHVAGMSTKE